MSKKVSEYNSATALVSTDIFYVIQGTNTALTSKKVDLATLFKYSPTKTRFEAGINLGANPQTLTNSGTIDVQNIGITALKCTQDSTFILPLGNQGDSKTILVEANPGFACVLSGLFSIGNVFTFNNQGDCKSFTFHNGKWYPK